MRELSHYFKSIMSSDAWILARGWAATIQRSAVDMTKIRNLQEFSDKIPGSTIILANSVGILDSSTSSVL